MQFTFREYNYIRKCTLEWHGITNDFVEIFNHFVMFMNHISSDTVRVTMELETITMEIVGEEDRDIH